MRVRRFLEQGVQVAYHRAPCTTLRYTGCRFSFEAVSNCSFLSKGAASSSFPSRSKSEEAAAGSRAAEESVHGQLVTSSLLSLAPRQQKEVEKLFHLLQKAGGRQVSFSSLLAPGARCAQFNKRYVVCRVVSMTPVATALAETVAQMEMASFMGVNHAYHKKINPPGTTLRGILKGCAEQNALGSAAASGAAYVDIAEVYLLAAQDVHCDSATQSSQRGNKEAIQHGASPAKPWLPQKAAATFPCPECWHHLCHVAQLRQLAGRPPLRLFVCTTDFMVAAATQAAAQQQLTKCDNAVEVMVVMAAVCPQTPAPA